jgi:Magnesium chelatase, subunit ChlI
MLARRLTTILPEMSLAEAIETTRIHNVAGLTDGRTALVTSRPFRAPHHTISDVGLIGGGQVPLPGEVSLAHHGVLFLDELPEFRRHVLEGLCQPLEQTNSRLLPVLNSQLFRSAQDVIDDRACAFPTAPYLCTQQGPGTRPGYFPRKMRSPFHPITLPRPDSPLG